MVKLIDGSMGFYELHKPVKDSPVYHLPDKKWLDMSSTEQEVLVHIAAKKNLAMDELKGTDFWQSAGAVEAEMDAETVAATRAALEKQEGARKEARCRQDMARDPVYWTPVGMEVVTANHTKRSPGMVYGLEFPWNEATLAEMGPQWLTIAFQRAGTLEMDNAVTAVILEQKIKVTGGNNGGKFLFEVKYQKQTPGLHTKLFAKVPFPCSGPTKSDRISSSVYKQPMDLVEINAYRLLESRFPMKTPKFYYGDISNETTNFIIITERVAFAEVGGKWLKRSPRPFEIEGPYDKCKDWQFRSPAFEYYVLLFQTSAKIAGLCKSGRIADPRVLDASFGKPRGSPSSPEAWGMNPEGASGGDPKIQSRKLEQALDFMKTARVVFPEFVTSDPFRKLFVDTLMIANAYKNEIDYWKHSDEDYISLAHANLNSDNAYFWHDDSGKLECGVFDWGGLSMGCLGHKLWWCVNCADFENTSVNLQSYIDIFVSTYHEYGGPKLDPKVLETQIFLTSLDNMLFMVAAVPNCNTMFPLKDWPTVKDRHDPRIAGDVDGKSTLRTTWHVLDHGVRLLDELGADLYLEEWIEDIWCGEWGMSRKVPSMMGLED